MDNNEQLFELMTKMYTDMQNEFGKMRNDMQNGFSEVNHRLDKLEIRVTLVEQDHGKKLDVLLDGYVQNSESLNRIEKEVSRHEEFILKRLK